MDIKALNTDRIFNGIINGTITEGELVDFKLDWIDYSKIAKIMISMANCFEFNDSRIGMIVFGVADPSKCESDILVGLSDASDESVIRGRLSKWVPDNLSYNIINHSIGSKIFQIIAIKGDAQHIPYMSKSGKEGVSQTDIFIRHGSMTALANKDDIDKIIINRSKCSRNMSFEEHIEQLETLYRHKISTDSVNGKLGMMSRIMNGTGKELFQANLDKLIEIKTAIIRDRMNM